MRAIRGGSIWRRHSDGWHVRIVFGRHGFVGAVSADDPQVGWLGWEEDFRRDFEWVAGR